MLDKKVSVIIATYRRDWELSRALESVAEQSYKNYEIIVVDDNDAEKWNQVVKQHIEAFRESHPDIELKYVQNHPNLGSAETRNVGIRCAAGEYVCFLDDDDLYLPNRIIHQLQAMVDFAADYSITDLALYSEAEKLIEVRKRNYIKEQDIDSLIRYHLMHHMTGTDTLMFKQEYLERMGGFDPIDMGDEFYLMMKAIEHQGRFVYVPVCDVKAFVHTGENGISSGQSKIEGENILFSYKKNFFTSLDKKAKRYIKMRHYFVLGYAGLRTRKWLFSLKNIVIGFLSSPVQCITMICKMR